MLWIVFELFLVMGLTWGSEVVNLSFDWTYGTSHYLGKYSSSRIYLVNLLILLISFLITISFLNKKIVTSKSSDLIITGYV